MRGLRLSQKKGYFFLKLDVNLCLRSQPTAKSNITPSQKKLRIDPPNADANALTARLVELTHDLTKINNELQIVQENKKKLL